MYRLKELISFENIIAFVAEKDTCANQTVFHIRLLLFTKHLLNEL